MPLWFLGQKIKREIYVTRIHKRISDEDGMGIGKEVRVKTKNKKTMQNNRCEW